MRTMQPLKILALEFKSLGDTVLMIPALRALRDQFEGCALHVLVKEEAAPILRPLPWLTRVWTMPRARGRARVRETWPTLWALRRERFDRSVDFAGNDRGAILSLLCGARQRLGPICPGGFLGRRFCYTQGVALAPSDQHETLRLIHVLSGWAVRRPFRIEIQLQTSPDYEVLAKQILPEPRIICHLGAGRPNRQWLAGHWAALHKMALSAGHEVLFSTGQALRERALFEEVRKSAPEAQALPPMPDLGLFLAVLKRARVVISGDTGPMHFAAGLGVPTIALFGPSSAVQWGPVGEGHHVLFGSSCVCQPESHSCHSANPCLAAISPEQVMRCLQGLSVRGVAQ